MADPLTSSGIRDNYNRGIVADFLKFHVKDGSYLSVISAFFTIYAYDALKNYLDRIEHMDFLFGEPRFVRAHQTKDGTDMSHYDALIKKAVESIAVTFRKRVASSLLASRSAVIPDRQDQADESTDFELITWLVIEENQCEG